MKVKVIEGRGIRKPKPPNPPKGDVAEELLTHKAHVQRHCDALLWVSV